MRFSASFLRGCFEGGVIGCLTALLAWSIFLTYELHGLREWMSASYVACFDHAVQPLHPELGVGAHTDRRKQ